MSRFAPFNTRTGVLARVMAMLSLIVLSACGGGQGSDAASTAAAAVGAMAQALGVSNETTWVRCAGEGQYCAFSGTRDVRYGTPTQYVTRSLTNGTPCTNEVFGDPAYAQTKSCSYADTTAGDPPAWTLCAAEGQTCTFTGTRRVRYGTLTQNVIGTYTNQVACLNSVFGDPAYAQAKSCWYETTTIDPGPAPQWIVCANEGQFCAFTGTHTVRYGTPTQFVTGTYTDGVTCTNAVFGDPAVAQAKTCSYLSTATTPAPDPTPTPTDPTGPSGTNPPIVLNATTTAHAGDVVSLQGENFGTTPRVYFDGASAIALEIVNRVGTGWLAVQLPASAQGALILRVANSTGTSAQVKLNAARPLHLDALQLTPGGAFRIFGRNLLVAGSTPRVTVGGAAASLDLSRSDEYMLTATAPTPLSASAAAVITVDNGNGSGAATLDRTIQTLASSSGDPFGLGVAWASGYTAIAASTINAATDPRLSQKAVCDGSRDDSYAIQGAIELAAANGGGVVQLPAGRCMMLVDRMSLRSRVVVQGAGKASTEVVYGTNYPVAGTNLDLSGIRNMTLTNSGASSEGPLLKDSTRLVIQNVRIRLMTSRQMYLSGNTHFAIQNSDIEQTGSISHQGPYVLNGSAGLLFEGNTTQWVDGAPAFGQIHDSYLHANRFTRDARNQNADGVVHSMTLEFAHRVAVVGNTFDVANGPITNKGRNDGEAVLTEGGGTARTENLGNVASAGSNTLSDPSNTQQVDPFGTGTIPEDYGVAIVGGKGAGQTRRVVGYSRPTLNVDRAWDIVPDATSRYATFVWGLEKSLIKDNTFSQNPRGIWLYHTAVRDVDVIGNAISEGGGIYMRSYQNLSTRSFMPIYNVLIARNRVVNTTGQWSSYINSVFVNADARAFGIATLGIEMRSNEVTANRPNVSSNSEEYAGIEGYMNMMRVENYGPYESSVMPRLLGSILTSNLCTNCDVGVRIGTGAGGTTILNTRLVNSASAFADWATTSSSEKSTDTVIR